jgi:hypothetical protein
VALQGPSEADIQLGRTQPCLCIYNACNPTPASFVFDCMPITGPVELLCFCMVLQAYSLRWKMVPYGCVCNQHVLMLLPYLPTCLPAGSPLPLP